MDSLILAGDNPPHAIWLETQSGQLNASRWVADAIEANILGVPAFPSIGNHGTVYTLGELLIMMCLAKHVMH